MTSRTLKVALAAAWFAAALELGQSYAAEGTFQCSATGGADYCICKGGDNCSTMRKSGACSSALTCTAKNGVTTCTCTAALGSGGGLNDLRTPPPTKFGQP